MGRDKKAADRRRSHSGSTAQYHLLADSISDDYEPSKHPWGDTGSYSSERETCAEVKMIFIVGGAKWVSSYQGGGDMADLVSVLYALHCSLKRKTLRLSRHVLTVYRCLRYALM